LDSSFLQKRENVRFTEKFAIGPGCRQDQRGGEEVQRDLHTWNHVKEAVFLVGVPMHASGQCGVVRIQGDPVARRQWKGWFSLGGKRPAEDISSVSRGTGPMEPSDDIPWAENGFSRDLQEKGASCAGVWGDCSSHLNVLDDFLVLHRLGQGETQGLKVKTVRMNTCFFQKGDKSVHCHGPPFGGGWKDVQMDALAAWVDAQRGFY